MLRKSLLVLAALVLLALIALQKCSSYLGEGFISAPEPNIVAISDDRDTQAILFHWCTTESAQIIKGMQSALDQHKLSFVQAGTKIVVRKNVGGAFLRAKTGKQVAYHVHELAVVRIVDGPLNGRIVYVCPGTFYLLHAMP